MNIGGVIKKSSSSYYFVCCLCIFAVLSALTAVSALILSSSPSHAETSSVLASVTVPDVCTIAADNSSTAHTDTVGVGEYKANIGETVFNITCNDNNGYSIYAVGYSNNTEGNTNLIGTTNSSNTIPTGTSTATGGSAVSNWAMKLTAASGTFPATILDSYDSYHVVPSTATKVATRTSSIDLSADSQIKTTYAVSISPAQTADSYVGKVKYTVVHPNYSNADGSLETFTCTKQYRLENADGTWGDYIADSTENVTGGNACSYSKSVTDYQAQSTSAIVASDTTLSLSLPRNTYALTINRNTTYISSVSGAGTYRWGQSVPISATISSGNEFTSWSQTSGTTGSFGNVTSASTTFTMPKSDAIIYADGEKSKLWFQNATSANCGSTMYDKRGTDVYKNVAYTTATIGGLCWMTRNLDLPGGTTLTSSDTNLTTGFTLPASSTNGFYDNYTTDYLYNSDSTDCSSSNGCYSYYAFYTATAHWGTNNVSSGSSSVDICPKGWRLPTQAELNTLMGTYTTGDALAASPFLGVYAGFYNWGMHLRTNREGFYWSSTAYNGNNNWDAYHLHYDSSSAIVKNLNKFNGCSIRCVAKS